MPDGHIASVQVLDLNSYGAMLEGATVLNPLDGHADILLNAQLAGGAYIYAVQSVDADRMVIISMDMPMAASSSSPDTPQTAMQAA